MATSINSAKPALIHITKGAVTIARGASAKKKTAIKVKKKPII